MADPSPPPNPVAPQWLSFARSWRAAIILILAATALRLAYLAISPYALAEDEAHYWEWSRHLDWSYYSKGPGIAWTIAAGTALWGDSEFGVRCLIPLFAALSALAAAAGAYALKRDPRHAFLAAALVLLTPAFQIMALLATIDGPYVACWSVATLCAFLAIRRDKPHAWLGVGAAIAVGFLYKYTVLLIVPGIALAWWRFGFERSRERRSSAFLRSLIVGVLLALTGLIPVIIWNAQNDWVTVRHLLGHLHAGGGDVPHFEGERPRSGNSFIWILSYIGTQFVVGFPILLFAIMAFIHTRRMSAAERSDTLTFIAFAAPLLTFYLLISLFTAGEGNWAVAAYISLVPVAAVMVDVGMSDWLARRRAWRSLPHPRPRVGLLRRGPESPVQVTWHWALGVGIAVGIIFLRWDLLAHLPWVGKYVPTQRLRAGPEWAEAVQSHVDELKREGADPFIIASHYGRASLLSFYLPGRPLVYCASPLLPPAPEFNRWPGRKSQYDYWPEADLANPALLGRDAVLIGAVKPQWEDAFDAVEERGNLPGRKGQPLFIGRGFTGFKGHD